MSVRYSLLKNNKTVIVSYLANYSPLFCSLVNLSLLLFCSVVEDKKVQSPSTTLQWSCMSRTFTEKVTEGEGTEGK